MNSLVRAMVLLLAALPGWASGRELRFVTIDTAPWASLQRSRPAGFFPELVAELERRTGHTVRMAFEPFARIERELESGAADCTVVIWSDARERIVVRGATVFLHAMGVIGRRALALRDYADLRGLSISVLRGAAIAPAFDTDANLRKEFDTDYLIGIRKLARGRVDALAGAVETIRHLAEREGFGGLLGEPLVLQQTPLALQCSRRSGNLDLMPELNAAIDAMVGDGTIARIRREHGL